MQDHRGGAGYPGDADGPAEQADPVDFRSEVRNAVTLRAALLISMVLLLQLIFIGSYVGAFPDPQPRDIPIAVIAPEPAGEQLTRQLTTLDGSPLDPGHHADDAEDARERIERREIAGALVADPDSSTDTLLVASGAGDALSDALSRVVGEALREQQRTVTVQDVAPSAAADERGLAAFYLVVGWCVGGYLCAAALAASSGSRPATVRRSVLRLTALLWYALVAGAGCAVLMSTVLNALPGGIVPLSLVGALVIFAAGAATLALHGLFGMIGIGLATLLVVLLGNPSAGGAHSGPLLPPFWEAIGPWLIPGAGTWLIRSFSYFDGHAVIGPLLALAIWAVLGSALTATAALRRRERTSSVVLSADSSPADHPRQEP